MDTCIICGAIVEDYEPEMCCSGRDCTCQGMPIEPCTCSQECDAAVYDYIGLPFDERRKKADIPWRGENPQEIKHEKYFSPFEKENSNE